MSYADANWLEVARLVLLSRSIDELEVQVLAPQRKVPYQFSSSGHELADVLLGLSLEDPNDAAAVYYRSRPFLLASGMTAVEAFAAGMARLGGQSDGRDIGVTYNLPRRSRALVLPMAGGVGTQFAPAAGWAQAIRYRQVVLKQEDWSRSIAVALGGDGSVASNGFWAALNIATTQSLPLLLVILDNGYALSVPSGFQTPSGDIAANLSAFGNLKVLSGDGTEPKETSSLIGMAVRHVRSAAGPCLLRLHVPRLAGHTFVDDQGYRSKEEMEDDARRDPIPKLRNHLLSLGVSQEVWQRLLESSREEAVRAAKEADTWPEPSVKDLRTHLFFEGTPPRQGGLRAEGVGIPLGPSEAVPDGPRVNLVDAVRTTLANEMRLNPRLVVFGEDVGAKGGVHGATRDLQSIFGNSRVFDTSLSEEGIVGRSVGLAIAGLLPVPEIQFRKYAEPAMEQLSDLGTIRWRTAGSFSAPVVIRMPVGFGKTTGDPWHSMCGESVLAHTLGWRIAFPSNASDAAGLLRTALRGDDPTFFLEHRALLDTPDGRRPYPGDQFCLPFGKASVALGGSSLTVVTWGAMVPRCLEVGRNFPDKVEIIDLRTIIPWDREAVLRSVRKTGKLLVVHEDTLTGGFAGEIIALVGEIGFPFLDAPPSRMAVPDVPIPFSRVLAEAAIPTVSSIRQRVDELLRF